MSKYIFISYLSPKIKNKMAALEFSNFFRFFRGCKGGIFSEKCLGRYFVSIPPLDMSAITPGHPELGQA